MNTTQQITVPSVITLLSMVIVYTFCLSFRKKFSVCFDRSSVYRSV